MLGLRGAIACCGKEVCNKEIYDISKSDLRELFMAREVFNRWKLVVFRCDCCGARSRVHRCSACKCRWYCGAACQGEDWRLVHKEVCGKLKKGKKQRFNSDERKKASLEGGSAVN